MHKILLALFLIICSLLINSSVYAQEACFVACPAGTQQISGTECVAPATAADPTPARIPLRGTCAAGKTPSDPSNLTGCICNPNIAPVAPAPVRALPAAPLPPAPGAPAAPAAAGAGGGTTTNTSGGGQKCTDGIKAGSSGIMTAIGCVPTEPKEFVEGLLKYGTVAAGAIAFILMLLGALGLITAEGNPEAIKNSQERFYSAIIGLLLIIFSVLLMQVIGVDILGLPGFTR